MKYVGALFIFLACTGGGIYRALLLRRRARTLAELNAALELLRGEICGRLSDLPAALMAAGREKGETGGFFEALREEAAQIGDKPFSEIWCGCAAEKLGSLQEDELRAVTALGGILGRYDAETQGRAIDACRDRLAAAYALASAGLSGAMRTAVGAGVSIGLMITITLI